MAHWLAGARCSLSRALLLFAVFALAAAVLGLGEARSRIALADQPPAAPDRLIVGFRPGTAASDSVETHEAARAIPVHRLSRLKVDVVQVDPGQMGAALAAYQADPRVEFVEPDFLGETADVPDDPYFSKQWGMAKVQAPLAWNETKGSPKVKIAILDTGIDLDHPDLKGKVVAQKNFAGSNCTSNASVNDKHGHGTHVAGIAAAQTDNHVGVAGLGRASSLMIGKVLDDDGKGYYSWWICGITWAADNGAKVINLSLGGNSASNALKAAVDYAWSKGAVVVAAAGNNGSTAAFYPAYYSHALAVASTGSGDKLSSFSNRGGWVDLAAPGENIYSTLPNHSNVIGAQNYGSLSGTSMAAPHVAGLAALVWANGATSPAQVRDILQSSADKISGTGTFFASGRINAARAVGANANQPVESPPSNVAQPAAPTPTSTPSPTPGPTPTPAPVPSVAIPAPAPHIAPASPPPSATPPPVAPRRRVK